MAIRACKFCGSTGFRADRALAGRLVCRVCGKPIDSPSTQGIINTLPLALKRNKRWVYILVILVIFVTISTA